MTLPYFGLKQVLVQTQSIIPSCQHPIQSKTQHIYLMLALSLIELPRSWKPLGFWARGMEGKGWQTRTALISSTHGHTALCPRSLLTVHKSKDKIIKNFRKVGVEH